MINTYHLCHNEEMTLISNLISFVQGEQQFCRNSESLFSSSGACVYPMGLKNCFVSKMGVQQKNHCLQMTVCIPFIINANMLHLNECLNKK